ncbi:MAG: tRNA (5-methylaminomethyl-2-thiouridine)(34)-methyltransferase MnmD [Pseudomonadota bacterium]
MNQTAHLDWRDGKVPVSKHFDDPYYSLDDGRAETVFVYLGGNQLPERFVPGFHIAELGFGTGLSALLAWQAWREAGHQTQLHLTSFELYPMTAGDRERALAPWPDLQELAAPMAEALSTSNRFETPTFKLTVIEGDARQTLPSWQGSADAWFLDGFSPAKNPELWDPDLLKEVGAHTNPGGTCATYTAAGAVRRALAKAGFDVKRTQGFGRKRHMTVGKMP